MPLPEPQPREELHVRSIEMRGFRREDGLFDIEGRVVDYKTYPFVRPASTEPMPPGALLHDLWLRLTVDEDLVVRDIVAVSDATPQEVCREAVAPMRAMIGERIKAGWSNVVKAKLGGATGCTHLMELLLPLATAAYQTIAPVRSPRPAVLDRSGRPVKIDSCYAYASHRPLVRVLFPAHYTGEKTGPDLQRS
jgi:hypothetical protein